MAAATPARRGPVFRSLLLLAAAYALLVTALTWLGQAPLAAVQAPGPAAYDDVVTLAATLGAAAALTWLVLGCALAVRAEAHRAARPLPRPRSPVARLLSPAACRRLARILLGLSLVASPAMAAAPASAEPVPVAAAGVESGPVESGLVESGLVESGVVESGLVESGLVESGLVGSFAGTPVAGLSVGWTPDRPAAPVRSHQAAGAVQLAAPQPRPEHALLDAVTVRRGDTLWDIAAARLGQGATAGDVARAWPRWYAANRDVIGPDPALLQPGQQLRPPAGH